MTNLVAYQLTPDEAKRIEEYRIEKENERLSDLLHVTTLRIITPWVDHVELTGETMSFQSFCGEFGCDAYIPEELRKHRGKIFDMIKHVISSVYHDSCGVIEGSGEIK